MPPQEIRPPDWNLSLVLRFLSRPPFEPFKLVSDKHLTWKTFFLFYLTSAKRVSELHCLSFRVRHLRGWKSCTFSFLPDFVAKTQNPSIPDSRFEEFSVSSLDDSVGDNRAELLMCPTYALWRYSACPELSSTVLGLRACLSLLDGGRRGSPIMRFHFFWLHSVISMAHTSASEKDCSSLRVRAHEVRKVDMSLLFKRNYAVHQVLKAGTWFAQSTFLTFYLRDVTHRQFGHLHWPCGGGSAGRATH